MSDIDEEDTEYVGECYLCSKKTEFSDDDIDKHVCEKCQPRLGFIKHRIMVRTIRLLGDTNAR